MRLFNCEKIWCSRHGCIIYLGVDKNKKWLQRQFAQDLLSIPNKPWRKGKFYDEESANPHNDIQHHFNNRQVHKGKLSARPDIILHFHAKLTLFVKSKQKQPCRHCSYPCTAPAVNIREWENLEHIFEAEVKSQSKQHAQDSLVTHSFTNECSSVRLTWFNTNSGSIKVQIRDLNAYF